MAASETYPDELRYHPAHDWARVEGDEATLRLLHRRGNPFPDHPAAFVRARLFRYRYTTRAERGADGAWWIRSDVGIYLPPVHRAPETTAIRP